MFIVYVKNTFELAYLDDISTELTPEIDTMLKEIYGSNVEFDFFIDTDITHVEFSQMRDNNLVAGFGVELIDGLPKFVVTKKISITTDKSQIIADGIDTATITATVDDVTSTEAINFYINGVLVDSPNVVNGVAEIQVNATQTGTITIEAESTTKYGRNSITIQAVSV